MASDDDTIFIDVASHFDSRSADEAVSTLRSKFKGVGSQIGTALGSDVGQTMGKELQSRLPEAVEGLGRTLGQTIGGEAAGGIGSAIGGALGRAGSAGIGDFLKDLKDGTADLKSALSGGGLSSGVGSLVDGLKQVKDLPGPLQDVVSKTDEIKRNAEDLSNTFKGLPGVIGGLVGPLSALGATIAALWPQEKAGLFDKTDAQGGEDYWKLIGGVGGSWLERKYNQFFHGDTTTSAPATSQDYGDMLLGGGGGGDQASSNFNPGGDPKTWQGTLGSGSDAYDFFSSGQPLSPTSDGFQWGGKRKPAPVRGDATNPSGLPKVPGTPQTPRDLLTQPRARGSARGIPGSVPLIQNPDGTWTSPSPAWAHLIQRESGGQNIRQGITDANSGGNEAEGLFQITPKTWASLGGTEFAPNPLAASPQQQAAIAARIMRGNPSGSDWGAGMPGRENAGDLLAALGSPGGSRAPSAFGPPALPGMPSSSYGSQGGTSRPVTPQQQLGSGSGFGISGGLIGMAEQAGASAAGAFSFGGGSMAAELAEEQINLAVQKGGQAAATLAAAPFEEFGLAGGMMGAPSVNVMGGWPGKLLSGLIGSQFSSPNTAGGAGAQTQQPKQPGQQEGQGETPSDPNNGDKSQQGPTGSADDPMHVNVTNQPPPALGAANSAANMMASPIAIT